MKGVSIIQFLQGFFHGMSNAVIGHQFRGDVRKSDVVSLVVEGLRKIILAQAISFAHASFEQVALHGTFEKAFGHRNHDFGLLIAGRQITHPEWISHKTLTLGKEVLNGDFALEALSFVKCKVWHGVF